MFIRVRHLENLAEEERQRLGEASIAQPVELRVVQVVDLVETLNELFQALKSIFKIISVKR